MKKLISNAALALRAATPARRRGSRHDRQQLEVLEERVLPSSVTVSLQDGDVIVEGDGGNNDVTLRRAANNIQVQGHNGTQVYGFVQFPATRLSGDLHIALGAGGANTIRIERVTVPGDVEIRGGRGNDRVAVLESQVGGNVSAKTGDGADVILVSETEVSEAVSLNTGKGSDKVGVGGATVGDVVINTGNGRDEVLMGLMTVQDDINMKTGSGNDAVFMAQVTVEDDLKANMGRGNDSLWVSESEVAGSTSVNGGSGFDAFEQYDSSFNSQPRVRGIESLFVPDADGRALTLAIGLLDVFSDSWAAAFNSTKDAPGFPRTSFLHARDH